MSPKWRPLACYDGVGLRTNNDLETYLRRIRTGQRRILSRKSVHFIIRYRCYVTCSVDYPGTLDGLLIRLQRSSHEDILGEQPALGTALLREQEQDRFRHHRAAYLRELEERWAAAVNKLNCGLSHKLGPAWAEISMLNSI